MARASSGSVRYRASRLLGLLALLAVPALAQPGTSEDDPAAAADTGCRACHADVHDGGHPLYGSGPGTPACVDCHRNAGSHPRPAAAGAPAMLTFTDEPLAERVAPCAGCHQDVHAGPGGNAHVRAGVACDGCHASHGEPARDAVASGRFAGLDAVSAVCSSCHEEVLTRFAFNERHRLVEGSVTCVSCHDPHGPPAPALALGGVDEACADCHRSTVGPFVFEHGASRVDGCSACHEPHGNANRHLLTHQREAELCYSCHLAVPQFHIGFAPGAPARFGLDTVCTNCHTTIHGSNLDRSFLR